MSDQARYPGTNSDQDNTGRGITTNYLEYNADTDGQEINVPLFAAKTVVRVFVANLVTSVIMALEVVRPKIGDELTLLVIGGGSFTGSCFFSFTNTASSSFQLEQEGRGVMVFVFDGEVWVESSKYSQPYSPPPA